MKKTKSPKDPIVLSEKSCNWLDNLLKKNEKRTKLTQKEKELLKGSKRFDSSVKSFNNEFCN